VHGQRKGGEIFPIELSVGEARTETEVLYTAIIRDVSERERTVQELRDSEARFATFMDHLPGVAFIKDIQGRYVYVNRTFGELVHATPDEVLGQTDDEVWPTETARQFDESNQRVFRDRAPMQTIEILPHEDGRHEWLVSRFPILDPEGEPCMVGGIAVDVTARRQAEARILDLEKAAQQRQRLADIGAITAQIVHDLGNPIAAISMQAQLIARRARRDGNEAVLKPAEQIVSRVRYLDVMIREFLDFTREQRLSLNVVHLAPLLSEVVALWQPVAGAAVPIGLELPSQVPPIVADEEKLRRVFDNLIKNAVEAIDSGPGSIRVRVSVPGRDKVRVSIEDSGPGIPQDLEIFRLFETTKALGTGLGLPIVQQIVLAHGGGIEFASLEPHGAVFHVDLRRRGPAG
jgi:PAS domain S-box-containing protein